MGFSVGQPVRMVVKLLRHKVVEKSERKVRYVWKSDIRGDHNLCRR